MAAPYLTCIDGHFTIFEVRYLKKLEWILQPTINQIGAVTTYAQFILVTRQSSCVTARGVPPARNSETPHSLPPLCTCMFVSENKKSMI